jgi:hypothetical protein
LLPSPLVALQGITAIGSQLTWANQAVPGAGTEESLVWLWKTNISVVPKSAKSLDHLEPVWLVTALVLSRTEGLLPSSHAPQKVIITRIHLWVLHAHRLCGEVQLRPTL